MSVYDTSEVISVNENGSGFGPQLAYNLCDIAVVDDRGSIRLIPVLPSGHESEVHQISLPYAAAAEVARKVLEIADRKGRKPCRPAGAPALKRRASPRSKAAAAALVRHNTRNGVGSVGD